MGAMCSCFGINIWDIDLEDANIEMSQNNQRGISYDNSYTNIISKFSEFYGTNNVMPLATEKPQAKQEDNYDDDSDDDDNCCPTCLHKYTAENPKIVAKCSHHYHLPCIFAWQERSNLCPACSRVMEFDESV